MTLNDKSFDWNFALKWQLDEKRKPRQVSRKGVCCVKCFVTITKVQGRINRLGGPTHSKNAGAPLESSTPKRRREGWEGCLPPSQLGVCGALSYSTRSRAEPQQKTDLVKFELENASDDVRNFYKRPLYSKWRVNNRLMTIFFNIVYRATVLTKILYCSPAWSGIPVLQSAVGSVCVWKRMFQ